MTPEQKMSYEETKAINDDLDSFLDNAKNTDKKLRDLNTSEDQENKSIFSNGNAAQTNNAQYKGSLASDPHNSPLVQELERQNIAENERLKGNEFVKAKDFKLAVICYTRSIELNGDEAFTYANRAMAYLKLKEYAACIQDSSKAIELKPGYLKAFHRRGKGYQSLGKFEQAIKDF